MAPCLCIGGDEDAVVQLGQRRHGYGDLPWQRGLQLLLGVRDDNRGVEEAPGYRDHGSVRSSRVPSSAMSWKKPGSGLPPASSFITSAPGTQRRLGYGVSKAMGRPSTVIRKVSPFSVSRRISPL